MKSPKLKTPLGGFASIGVHFLLAMWATAWVAHTVPTGTWWKPATIVSISIVAVVSAVFVATWLEGGFDE